MIQNSAVEHSSFIFNDKDSPEVNDYKIEVLEDSLGILKPDCRKLENDRYGTPQTALICSKYRVLNVNFILNQIIYSC